MKIQSMVGRVRMPSYWLCAAPIFLYALLLSFFFFDRGFDITDEGYYLVNFLHWQSLTASLTFFGAYLGPLFKVLNEDIWLLRITGFLLLAAAGLFFSRRFFLALRLDRMAGITASMVATCAVAAFYSPSYTLYTPGYNLLALVLLLISTGAVLPCAYSGKARFHDLSLYGLCMGGLLFTKFPCYFIALVAHLLLFVFCAPAPAKNGLLFVGAAIGGAFLNLIALLVAGADIVGNVRSGMNYIEVLQARNVVDQALKLIVVGVGRTLVGSYTHAWLALPLAVIGLTVSKYGRVYVHLIAASIALLVFGPLGFGAAAVGRHSSLLLAMAALVILYGPTWRAAYQAHLFQARDVLVVVAMAFFPFVHAAGTGSDIRHASAMAVIFPTAGCLAFISAASRFGAVPSVVLAVWFVAAALAPIQLILEPWNDAKRTYRLGTPLREQGTMLTIYRSHLRVDAATAKALNEFRALLNTAHFKPRTSMLDLTGASPGLIIVANATPIGRAWVLGGYPGSEGGARYVLSLLKPSDISAAWILASPDNDRRLDVPRLLEKRLGGFPYKRVGMFRMPFTNVETNTLVPSATVEIWAPCGQCASIN